MGKDDLLDMEPKKDFKKPLIYGAIAFLVFIIVVIAVAIFQNVSTSTKKNNQVLPPEQNNTTNNVQSQFKPIAVTNAQNNQNESNTKTTQNTQKTQPSAETTQNTQNSQTTKQNVSQNNQEAQAPQQTTNAQKPSQVENKNTKVSKSQINQQIQKQSKPKINTTKKISKTYGHYYIQVAALLKNSRPNKKFISLIVKDGFKYTYYKTYIYRNGEKIKVTKVLIGPYNSRKEALKALSKVKRDITQTAFIFKVK